MQTSEIYIAVAIGLYWACVLGYLMHCIMPELKKIATAYVAKEPENSGSPRGVAATTFYNKNTNLFTTINHKNGTTRTTAAGRRFAR